MPSGDAAPVPRRVAVGVGIAEIGASLTFVAVNTWLLYYLVNVAAVPALAAGAVFVIGRVVDAVTDPLMGILSDRLRPRLGRLAFVRWGALPLGAAFAVLWFAPARFGDAATLAALGALVLVSLLYTVVQMPVLALTPELAPTYDQRTGLTSVRVAFSVLASMAAVAVPPVLVLAVEGGSVLAETTGAGWAVMGMVFGAITVVSYLLLPALVREPAYRPLPAAPRVSPLTVFATTGYASVLVVFLLVTFGLMLVNSMLPFVLESVLRIPGEAQTLVLGLLFVTAVLTFPAWNVFTRAFGKRVALSVGALLLGGGVWSLVAWSPPGGVSPTLLAFTALAGVGLAAVMATPWSMVADVVEFDALRCGARREGLIYAVFTFGQKLAGSLGVFANALAAAMFGYVQGAAEQGPATIAGFSLVIGPIAFVVFALAAAVVWTSPITRDRHGAARRALEGRMTAPADGGRAAAP